MEKRICFINGWYEGSTGRIVQNLGSFFTSRGFSSSFVYRLAPKIDQKDVFSVYQNNISSFLYKGVSRILGTEGFTNVHSTRKMIAFLKRENPSLISLHNPHPYYLNVPMLIQYSSDYRIPILWTLHDEWVLTGRCCYSQKCERFKSGCKKCPHKDYYPMEIIGDKSADFWAKKREIISGNQLISFVSPSKWLQDFMLNERFGFKNDCVLIKNPIDFGSFKRTPKLSSLEKAAHGRKIVGGAAQLWTSIKGIELFSELANRLNPDLYFCVIVGSINKKMRLSQNLHILPEVSDKKALASFYSTCDVFVNPTLADNAPTVNVESLACGTPVVSFDSGGAAEPIKNGLNGFVAKSGDINDLEAKTKISLETSFSSSACRDSVADHDPQFCCDEYFRLVNRLINL